MEIGIIVMCDHVLVAEAGVFFLDFPFGIILDTLNVSGSVFPVKNL